MPNIGTFGWRSWRWKGGPVRGGRTSGLGDGAGICFLVGRDFGELVGRGLDVLTLVASLLRFSRNIADCYF